MKKTKVFWTLDHKNHISIKITEYENKVEVSQAHYNFSKEEIRLLMGVLDFRYREVLRLRFGLDEMVKLQREVAEELGIYKHYVADIERRAILKMIRFYEDHKK